MKDKDNEAKDMQNRARPDKAGFITKASAQYCNVFPLRAAIQAIPGLGSSLDTMLAGLGAKWQYKRLEDFIAKLNERLSRLEQIGRLQSIEPSEPLFDFMMQTFDQVIKARSEEKRKWFANLVAKQVTEKCDWDEAETACRLIGALSDNHIRILEIAINAPCYDDFFGGRGVITIEDRSTVAPFAKDKVTYLKDILDGLTPIYVRMMCVELLSRSLLFDLQMESIDTVGQQLYSASGLAMWLMDWISEPGKTKNAGDSD
jgi:hypothetical protein